MNRNPAIAIMAIISIMAAIALPGVAAADFSHVEVRDVSEEVGTPPGLRTWRVFAIFVPPLEAVLAISGTPEIPLVFETNDPDGLFNDGGLFDGLKAEDFAQAPISAEFDSWVSIGSTGFAGNCTDYSPGFLDNNGIDRVIVGTSWIEDTGQGWYDSHPGSPENGPEVVIAQFTVGFVYGVSLSGNIDYNIPGQGTVSRTFCASSLKFASSCLCPPDIDDDLEVSFSDLLLMLSSWGPCPSALCCREDLDGSGDVDFQDLLLVLSAWGPCPAPGACCFPDGSCAPARCLDGDECADEGGVYQGVGTSCADAACPPPAACCMLDGTCTAQFESDCLASGGTPQGDDTRCVGIICPQPGACCLDDGACNLSVMLGGPICLMAGGTYQGDDTRCEEIACPQPGACCMDDGSCVQAAMIGSNCAAEGGIYQGDDTLCREVGCPQPGACCFLDPACVIVQEEACLELGGSFVGEETVCDVDCTRGACCLPDGSCFFVPPETCGVLGGSFEGAGLACEAVRCP